MGQKYKSKYQDSIKDTCKSIFRIKKLFLLKYILSYICQSLCHSFLPFYNPGEKRPWQEDEHPFTFIAVISNVWEHISLLLYAFVTCVWTT